MSTTISWIGQRSANERCFYCGKDVDRGIYWMGTGKTIYLHAPCATNFAAHLLKDMLEFQYQQNDPSARLALTRRHVDLVTEAENMREEFKRVNHRTEKP